MTADMLKPVLYAAEGTAAVPDHPSLKGGKCSKCGYVFFPMQHYGCELCGEPGEALRPQALGGRGTLIASARVHIHAARTSNPKADVRPREAPFTIGSIKLDDGPTVRTLLVESDTPLQPGQKMVTALVTVSSSDRAILDLRFAAAS